MSTFRCSNDSMISKTNRIADMIRHGTAIMATHGPVTADAAVITEAMTMGITSVKCCHTVRKKKGLVAYERMDPDDIPSYVEDININATICTATNTKSSTRSNLVTCAVISDCISVLEFSDRVMNGSLPEARLVIMGAPSVTHAAMIAYVFECVAVLMSPGVNVKLDLVVDQNTLRPMQVYTGPRANTNVISCNDDIIYASKIMCSSSHTDTTIVAHGNQTVSAIMKMAKNQHVHLNLYLEMNTIKLENEVRYYCTQMNMLVEMCPCSPVDSNTVRMVPVFLSINEVPISLKTRDVTISMFGKMHWYNAMIRHATVGSMCYDCRIAIVISREVLKAMGDTEIDENGNEQMSWVDSFYEEMDVSVIVD